ncbi:hypothetical protein LWC33_28875 [Pseudonocardia sp. RS11V-5]|uniref:hypothetical protein n=1 Tax=Pseudonocardia terrae TaxID=2905831 RepID=UPI001E51CDDD|nr:hypothetical protein [Pseudonocardia terrae]MCE3555447.1 hypothetical protein [Pseudonocardia terrae]
MTARKCRQCGDPLPPRTTNMGPAPRYCSVRCRRDREHELARKRRAARSARHWARVLGGTREPR